MKKNLLVISHINPFSLKAGQELRQFYTLKSLKDKFNITVLSPEYYFNDEKIKSEFINNNFLGDINFISVPVTKKFYDKLKIFNTVYIKGLKSSNFHITNVFKTENILNLIDITKFDILLCEYWHSFQTAIDLKKIKNSLITICDTHNILSSTYELTLKDDKIKKIFRNYYFSKYSKYEFDVALRSFDYLISINEEENRFLINKFGTKRVIYCPMGTDLSKFEYEYTTDITKNYFNILYYGGLGSVHNQNHILWIYENIISDFINSKIKVNLTVIGGSAPQTFINKLNKPGIIFKGYCPNLNECCNDIDLALIPWEGKYGFRSRIIELMAIGIPVLTSSDAVWGMGFKNGENIFIFDKFTSDVIKDKILFLKFNKDKLKSISLNAYEFISNNYSFENTYLKLANSVSQLN